MRTCLTLCAALIVLPMLKAVDRLGNAEPYNLRKSKAVELAVSHSPFAIDALKALLKEKPDDAAVLFSLGTETAVIARKLEVGNKRKKEMRQAREYIVRAQKAGSTQPMIATALSEINPDGSENIAKLSEDPKMESLLQKAEEAFGKGDFVHAKEAYEAALAIDPTNYVATVYLGDAYFSSKEFPEALRWFQKAIELNPDFEKAHRYSGDTLLRLNRKDDALDQYLLAVVAEPYSQYPWTALQHGYRAFLLKPWQAAIKIPVVQVKEGTKGPEIALSDKFTNWDVAYSFARAKWQTENRATMFPAGHAYRQSLLEEVYALKTLITIYHEMKASPEQPNDSRQALTDIGPSLDELAEIEQAGFLSEHILFFRANAEIARDYADYRAKNREKLLSYLRKYYLHLP